MRNSIRMTVLYGVLGMPFSNVVAADVINVPVDQLTIQGAINVADEGDEVVVAPGTYREIINLLGKAITVRSSGGASVTTIDATTVADPGTGKPVIRCVSGEEATTVIDGFTITGGTGDNTLAHGGGGMFNDDSSPTVTNCVFDGNTAANGGGMSNNNASPTVTNCTFRGNTATSGGGGMVNNNASPIVTNCAFSGNTAGFGGGGMLNLSGSPAVTSCRFSGNSADVGGGMWTGAGGGLMVTNCMFSGNSAIQGGGMLIDSFTGPTVTSCTFSGNTAVFSGGGMLLEDNADPTVTDCIFWGNSAAQGGPEISSSSGSGRLPVISFSDVRGGLLPGRFIDGGGNIDADPLFVDADGPDGIVGTEDDNLRLLPGSPCIDAGNNGPVTEPADLDGNVRIVNCTVDIGAYEDQTGTPFLVHNITQNRLFHTLQAAIDAAIAGDVIEAGACTFHETIDFKGKAITVRSASGDPSDTIIDGTGNFHVVQCISGETAETVLAGFTITGGNAPGFDSDGFGGGMLNDNFSSPTVMNCTFRRNSARNGAGMHNRNHSNPAVTACAFIGNTAAFHGGGMRNLDSSSPSVTDCVFGGNTATSGGGMQNTDSNPTVTSCTFIRNTADFQGGGMYNKDSSPKISDSMFTQNAATLGGGICNIAGNLAVTGTKPSVSDCSFLGNTAVSSGGGMFNDLADTTAISCTFNGNTSGFSGGGMWNGLGNPLVMSSVFSGNVAGTFGGGMFNTSTEIRIVNCAFSENRATNNDGGGMSSLSSTTSVASCIFWGNSDRGGTDFEAQIHTDPGDSKLGFLAMNHSDVQGFFPGGGGTGNIGADPLFVNAAGIDGFAGTDDDDLHLSVGSPCIDAGDSTAAAAAGLQVDLDGNIRGVDDPTTPNTGVSVLGLGVVVDMGAYELQAGLLGADLDKDGDVDLHDYALFIQQIVGPS